MTVEEAREIVTSGQASEAQIAEASQIVYYQSAPAVPLLELPVTGVIERVIEEVPMTAEEARQILSNAYLYSEAEITEASRVYYGTGGYYSQQESTRQAESPYGNLYRGYPDLASEVMAKFGITREALEERYGEGAAENTIRLLNEGFSPLVMRELDAWTGQIHAEYVMPEGSPNVNIWQMKTDAEGAITSVTWKGPGPAPGPVPTVEELYVQHYSKPTPTQIASPPTDPAGSVKLPSGGGGGHSTATPPGGGTGAGGTGREPMGQRTKTPKVTVTDIDQLIKDRAGGDGMYTWDEWNWFYEQVTGTSGPAPEDRGFTRNAEGYVLIDGAVRFSYATWKSHAFPSEGLPPAPPAPPLTGLFEQLVEWLQKLLKWLVGGAS